MTYDWTLAEALAWLEDHVNLEVDPAPRAAAMRLERVRRLAYLLGDPHRAAPVIHVTGTNGKGSSVRMITRLLVERGLSVGTFLSPHLERLNERIVWNGAPLSDDDLASAIGAVAAVAPMLDDRPSYFEILTAAAFAWFAEVAVDVVVLEVGLGGRLDATNIADGTVAVVTNVAIDHAAVIGPTRVDIAREKSGIVKPGATLVLGETDDELAEVFSAAEEVAGAVWRRGEDFACLDNRVAVGGRLITLATPGETYRDVFLPVHGAHQGDNAACAVAAVEAFFGAPLDPKVVDAAFDALELPGRMEVVARQPLTILDGAHNAAGAAALGATLDEEFDVAGRRLVVFGTLTGHDPADLLEHLDPSSIALLVACEPPSPRAVPADDVVAAARRLGIEAFAEPDVSTALRAAQAVAAEDDLLLVTGSLYLVGAARRWLR